MNSRGPTEKVHIKRTFTLSVAICMGVIMPGDLKVAHINQIFRFNHRVFVLSVTVPLYANI